MISNINSVNPDLFMIAASLFFAQWFIFQLALNDRNRISAIFYNIAISLVSVILFVFFSYQREESEGNTFAICIMICTLCNVCLASCLFSGTKIERQQQEK